MKVYYAEPEGGQVRWNQVKQDQVTPVYLRVPNPSPFLSDEKQDGKQGTGNKRNRKGNKKDEEPAAADGEKEEEQKQTDAVVPMEEKSSAFFENGPSSSIC